MAWTRNQLPVRSATSRIPGQTSSPCIPRVPWFLYVACITAGVLLPRNAWAQTSDDIPADAPPAVRAAIADTFSSDQDRRLAALETLRKQKDGAQAAIPCLIRIIGRARDTTRPHIPSMNEAYTATSILAGMGDHVIPAMVKASRSGNKNVRESAVTVLRQFPEDPRVSPVLIALLYDPTRDVRRAAASALGHVPSPRATEELILLLKLDKEAPIVRHVAALSLGQIGSKAAVEPLVAAAASDNRDVRCGAYLGLACLKQTDVLLRLFEKGTGTDPVEGEQLVWALARTRDPRAAEVLARLQTDLEDGKATSVTVTSMNTLRNAILHAQGRPLSKRPEAENSGFGDSSH